MKDGGKEQKERKKSTKKAYRMREKEKGRWRWTMIGQRGEGMRDEGCQGKRREKLGLK